MNFQERFAFGLFDEKIRERHRQRNGRRAYPISIILPDERVKWKKGQDREKGQKGAALAEEKARGDFYALWKHFADQSRGYLAQAVMVGQEESRERADGQPREFLGLDVHRQEVEVQSQEEERGRGADGGDVEQFAPAEIVDEEGPGEAGDDGAEGQDHDDSARSQVRLGVGDENLHVVDDWVVASHVDDHVEAEEDEDTSQVV